MTGTPAGPGTNMITVGANSLSWLQSGDGDLYVKSSYFRIPSQLADRFCIASPLNAEEDAEQIVLFRGHCVDHQQQFSPRAFCIMLFFFPRETETLGTGALSPSVGPRKRFLRRRHKTDQPPLPSPIHTENLFRLKSGGSQSHHISIPVQGQSSDPSGTLNVYPWQTEKKKVLLSLGGQLTRCSTSVWLKEGFRFT